MAYRVKKTEHCVVYATNNCVFVSHKLHSTQYITTNFSQVTIVRLPTIHQTQVKAWIIIIKLLAPTVKLGRKNGRNEIKNKTPEVTNKAAEELQSLALLQI